MQEWFSERGAMGLKHACQCTINHIPVAAKFVLLANWNTKETGKKSGNRMNEHIDIGAGRRHKAGHKMRPLAHADARGSLFASNPKTCQDRATQAA